MSEDVGQAVVLLTESATKAAAAPATSYGMKGKLYLSKSGWILLSVPNSLVRGAFDALNEPGITLPDHEHGFNAHITVMRPEEIEELGGADKVTERGQEFPYTLGPVKTVNPAGWAEMSKVWYIEVKSPELKKLRKTYGLTALPNENKHEFHITIATRKKGVLGANGQSKAAAIWSREEPRLGGTQYANISDDTPSGTLPIEGDIYSTADVIRKGNTGAVFNLETAPDHRRQGHARELLRSILRDDPAKTMLIAPGPYQDEPMSARKLRRFYRREGFKRTKDPDMIATFRELGDVDPADKLDVMVREKADPLKQLKAAKAASDAGNYREKHKIMRELITTSPDDFRVDSAVGNVNGITHIPTGFKMHLPTKMTGHLKAASFYLDALKQTPVTYDTGQNPLSNVMQHLQKARSRGDRKINEAIGWDQMQNAMDPNRATRRLEQYLTGSRKPIVHHWLDRTLQGDVRV